MYIYKILYIKEELTEEIYDEMMNNQDPIKLFESNLSKYGGSTFNVIIEEENKNYLHDFYLLPTLESYEEIIGNMEEIYVLDKKINVEDIKNQIIDCTFSIEKYRIYVSKAQLRQYNVFLGFINEYKRTNTTVDMVLDKILKEGAKSLTPTELAVLGNYSS